MSHEIISVKLCELDNAVGCLYRRIQYSESVGPCGAGNSLAGMCETAEMFRQRLKFSKPAMVSNLLIYDKVECFLSLFRWRFGKLFPQKKRFAGGMCVGFCHAGGKFGAFGFSGGH